MKKPNWNSIISIVSFSIAVILAVILVLMHFRNVPPKGEIVNESKSEIVPPKTEVVNKSQYDIVKNKIGGDIYSFKFYDTAALTEEIKKLDPLNYLVAFGVSERDQKIAKTTVPNLLDASGLEKLDSAGSSVRKEGDGIYTYNLYLLSDKNPQGLIWDIFLESDEQYPMLDYMPENVWGAGAFFADYDRGFSIVVDALRSSAGTQRAYREFENWIMDFKYRYSVNIKKFASLVKGVGFYIPKKGNTLFLQDIPDFTVILRGTDDTLFSEVAEVAYRLGFTGDGKVFKYDRGAMTISIFRNKNDVVITTEERMVKMLIANDAKKLSDNAEFKKMKQAIPKKSAVWCFVPSATVEELVRFAEDESKRGYERNLEYLNYRYQREYEGYLRALDNYEYERSRGYTYRSRPTPPTPPAPKGKFPYADLFNKLKEYKTPITISATRDDDGLLFVIGMNTRFPLLLLGLPL